jgi:chitin-binding protein
MRRRIALPLLTIAAVLASLAVAVPAQAHGYVSSPPSRQALCAQGRVKNCGQIQYEPQSVEGPKGLRSCSGGNSRFAVLDDESKGWPATSVGRSVTFNWVFTARHATSNFEYYVGNTRFASFDGGGKQPPPPSRTRSIWAAGPDARRSSRCGTSPTPRTPSTPASICRSADPS